MGELKPEDRALIERVAGPLALIEMKAGQAHFEWATVARLLDAARAQGQPTGDGKPDRETAIAALRSALTEEWHDTVNARRWTEDVLLTGCRNVGGGKGYERAEDAAANLAGMAVDAILARQGPGPGEAVAWRYRHVPYVGWSYASTKPLRPDLEIEPLFAATPTREA